MTSEAEKKQFSLNDIFILLRETNVIFTNKPVTLLSEDDEGKQTSTPMMLSDFITMNIAHELVETFDINKSDVIAAMSDAGYEEIAYPEYEHYGLVFRLSGGKQGKGKGKERKNGRFTRKRTLRPT
jgi:hypothetical protein